MKKGKRNTFRERVPGREEVTKVVRPSEKRDPQGQSRRRPFPEYQLRGTKEYDYKLSSVDRSPRVYRGPSSVDWSLIG